MARSEGHCAEWLFAKKWRPSHWLVVALWLGALLALQWKLGHGFITQANQDSQSCDQGAYLDVARSNLLYFWPTASDGVHMPLFPFLLRPFVSDDTPAFFAAAKQANVCFGLVATVVLAAFFLRTLPLLPALNMGTISALIVLPISVFVTAEVVFYTAFFFLWIVGWRLLVANPLWQYALAGLLCAAAYLAKPSTMLFGICLVALSVARWVQIQRSREAAPAWSGRRLVIGAVVFYLSFLLPVLPKALDTLHRAGDPFQNTGQYCFWMDSWDECLPRLHYFTARHIAEMPAEERPSLGNYWRHHTLGQMYHRMSWGVAAQTQNFLISETTVKNLFRSHRQLRTVLPLRGAYPLALLAATLLLATQRATGASTTLADRRALWALAALGFAIHFLAFAFYTPIADGNRFILAVYIPVLFSLALGLEYLREERPQGWRVGMAQLCHVLIAAQLGWQLAHLATATAFTDPRGAF